MFDTINLRQGDAHHSHKHEVHEHRAPTDESVKLLRDMESAAKAAITSSTRVEDCALDVVVHQTLDMMNDEIMFVIVYRLAGTKYTVEHRHRNRLASKEDAKQRLIDGLRTALAQHIAGAILGRVKWPTTGG